MHISFEAVESIKWEDFSSGSYGDDYGDDSSYGYDTYGTTMYPDDSDHRRLAGSYDDISDSESCESDGALHFFWTTFAQFALLTVFWQEQVCCRQLLSIKLETVNDSVRETQYHCLCLS